MGGSHNHTTHTHPYKLSLDTCTCKIPLTYEEKKKKWLELGTFIYNPKRDKNTNSGYKQKLCDKCDNWCKDLNNCEHCIQNNNNE